MAKSHYHWTDAEIAEMVQMARAGDTYKVIGAHFGVNEKRIRTAFELRGLKITELVWEPGGVKRETLLKMLARRATKIEMQREIGCSKVTLRQRMEELGVADYRTAPPPKPKHSSLPSGDRGFREGKNARSNRVARLKRIENPPTVVPPHAVGIKRSGPPRGCAVTSSTIRPIGRALSIVTSRSRLEALAFAMTTIRCGLAMRNGGLSR